MLEVENQREGEESAAGDPPQGGAWKRAGGLLGSKKYFFLFCLILALAWVLLRLSLRTVLPL